MSVVPGEAPPRTYGHWLRPKSGGLLGLSTLGTGILFVGVLVTVLVVMFSDLLAALVTFLTFAVFLLAVTVKDKHGQSLVLRAATRIGWWSTKRKGANLYRSGPLGRAEWGMFQLPGLAAPTKLSEHYDSYNRPFALVYVPRTGHYTVVFGTEPDGAALVDREQVDAWVADWGLWLANLGDEPGVEAASVTVETAPDTGTRLAQAVGSRVDADAPPLARAMLADVVASYPQGSATVRAYVAVTFSGVSRTTGRRRPMEDVARELASRLPGLTQRLGSTGAGAARPLAAQELCEVVRIAYDPQVAPWIERANAAGEPPELSWPDVGPSAAEARWDSYRHDSGLSVTWMMTSAPRGNVQSSILTHLLEPHRDIARKRVTLLYRPIDPARAAAIVEADANAARFNLTATNKPTARASASTRAALATAEEEASGAGLVNFGMLVTATVTDPEHRAEAVSAVDNLSARARVRLRVVHGSQDSAFAAALPLGLVLPAHLQVPAAVREGL